MKGLKLPQISIFILSLSFISFFSHASETLSSKKVTLDASSPNFVGMVPKPPKINAFGYILMDYNTGEILASNNAHKKLHPASLTKILTSYVIGTELKNGNIKNDDIVQITENAWAKNFPGSSKMFLAPNQKVTVSELNQGIIIQSGNDACVALAEHIAGSQSTFVDMMNKQAQKLGMKNSHFSNVDGLDAPNLYTTPYDMAILSKALIKHLPEEYKIYSEKKFTWNGITQHNRNSLLWDKSLNVDGLKTGHTDEAGYSLITSATSSPEGKGMRLISVVMGTKSKKERAAANRSLLQYGFRFFKTVSPKKAGEIITTKKVWFGTSDEIKIGSLTNTYVTIPSSQVKNLKAKIIIDKKLEAPINKNQVVGEIFYELKGEKLKSYPLVALTSSQEAGFFSKIFDYISLAIHNLFS
ncbi:serine hydrolase [Paraphotobacterium marinum]|nr:serine hydrolase [Paraphotobacterium marinum]